MQTPRRTVITSLALVSRQGPGATFRYSAQNHGTEDVYVFNHLFTLKPSGEHIIDSNRVYIDFEDGSLALSKKLISIPDDCDLEHPEVPYVSLLPSGELIAEEFFLSQPLEPNNPYKRNRGQPKYFKEFDRIDFTLGYFTAKNTDWVYPVTVGNEHLVSTDYGFAIQTYRESKANPLGTSRF